MVPGHVRLWHWAAGCGACLLPLEALELGGPWRVCVCACVRGGDPGSGDSRFGKCRFPPPLPPRTAGPSVNVLLIKKHRFSDTACIFVRPAPSRRSTWALGGRSGGAARPGPPGSPETLVLLVSDLPGQQDTQGPGPVPRAGAGRQRPQARELKPPAPGPGSAE